MSSKNHNKILISAAGSRKTTLIVKSSIKASDKRILISTYTLDNLAQIKSYFINDVGSVPNNVNVQSWFSFLLADCVRPYQNYVYERRISNICFIEGKSVPFIKENNIEKHYFFEGDKIYTDKISKFAIKCNSESKGLVIQRLESIYDIIFIDEVQDMAGYDLELIELLLNSKIRIICVGDNRQATYKTNYSPKHKGFSGKNLISLFAAWESNGICEVLSRVQCYRCNQIICDFSDKLYPEMSKTISKNMDTTGHDGVFTVTQENVETYIERYKPTILRYDKKTIVTGHKAMNFGASKGLTFERVLVIPNNPIKEYLKKGELTKLADSTRAKFYVAITRARSSVCFLYDGENNFGIKETK
jgi:DNA helicase-2/ATP-dependent DNA helicase PcrA